MKVKLHLLFLGCLFIFLPMVANAIPLQGAINLSIKFACKDNTIVFTWLDPNNSVATKYLTQIYEGTTQLKSKETVATKRKYPADFFTPGTIYTFTVTIFPQDQNAGFESSPNVKKIYVHYLAPFFKNKSEFTFPIESNFFAVDDHAPDGTITLSAIQDGKLVMRRFDPNNPDVTVPWMDVMTPADMEGRSAGSQAHIFAYGFHWVLVSTADNLAAYLLKIRKEDCHVVDRIKVVDNTCYFDIQVFCNDCFLCNEGNGIIVAGLYLSNYGHIIFRYDANLENTNIGLTFARLGGGDNTHSNGANALAEFGGGYSIFAPTTLGENQEGKVRRFRFDKDWNLIKSKTILNNKQNENIAFVNVIDLNGFKIFHVRVVPDVTKPLAEKVFKIKRFVFSCDYELISEEVISNQQCDRPHGQVTGKNLITTWSEAGQGKMRIEKISSPKNQGV